MAIPQRYGMTVPFGGPLADHKDRFRELVDLGYTDAWSAEADGTDAFSPLLLAAAWAPELRLGTAIVPAYTRSPALLAQSVASLAEDAPGRVAFGIGTSSNVIVERWNGIPFEQPYQRTKESLQFVKRALEGGKVEGEWKTFSSNGFKLGRVPKVKPDYLVAALRPGMLRMAAKESDGAITNWLGADDVPKVKAELGDDKELVARILVAPNPDAEVVRKAARYAIAAYLNVPVYAQFHEWLGRGEVLKPMWEAWAAGDRKAALAAIPDSVCDELIVHGPPEACREQLARYHANGITTSALAVMPFGVDPDQAVRDLAPSTWAR